MGDTAFDLKIDEIIADKVANITVERLSDEKVEELVRRALNKVEWEKNGGYRWTNEPTVFQKMVMDALYSKVADKIKEVIESDEFVNDATEIANRIVSRSREVAERVLVEKIAMRMCINYTDFNNDVNKTDICTIVNEILNNHVEYAHNHY